jgi:tetratricopeptide (TPR) repeat protein
MALANTACLLSKELKSTNDKVLMIDWDLEAPGLHRYFHNQFKKQTNNAKDAQAWIDERPGLLDLFRYLNDQIPESGYTESKDPDHKAFEHAKQIIAEAKLEDYVIETDIKNLYLLKAGKFDDNYGRNVNSFQWDNLYERSPWLFRAFVEELARIYRYVLIDSRTGLTDTSNICTTLLPEKLVVVFTPNRQSFTGVEKLIKNATQYRVSSDDVRPLAVFPLPSRIASDREKLRKDWRYGNPEQGIEGYQPLFTDLFRDIYQLDETECDLEEYFSEVQIQQSPDFAFGEEIAVNLDEQQDRFSLARSYETFTQKLIQLDLPWEYVSPVDVSAQNVDQLAEKVFKRFNEEDQLRVQKIFTRLVRIALPGEGADTMKGANISEFGASAEPVIQSLLQAGLLIQRPSETGEDTVEVVNDALIRNWGRLQEWINSERDFLSWRQQLRAYLAEWEKRGRHNDELLSGTSLSKAVSWLKDHSGDLNEAEKQYIEESRAFQKPSSLAWLTTARSVSWTTLFLLIASLVSISYLAWSEFRRRQDSKLTAQATALTSRGREAHDAGNQNEAIRFYNQAIETKSDYADAYLNRGEAYRTLNQRENAKADYDKAISLSSDPEIIRLSLKGLDALISPSPQPSASPGASPAAILAPRIYVPLDSQQAAKFGDIEKALSDAGFTVVRTGPGAAPSITEVRYYRTIEEPLALQIVNVLKSHGVENVTHKYLEQSTSARPWHYEIYFSREALR